MRARGKAKEREEKEIGRPKRTLEQKAASSAGTLTEGDLEATWELRKKKVVLQCVSGRWADWEGSAPT